MYKSEITPLFPSAPKCGFIKGNEKIALLLERVKPEIVDFRKTIISVSDIYVGNVLASSVRGALKLNCLFCCRSPAGFNISSQK